MFEHYLGRRLEGRVGITFPFCPVTGPDRPLYLRRMADATKTMMIRYKTSAARAEENAALIRAIFDEIRVRAPGRVRYVTYRHADGVTFVHMATVTNLEKDWINALPSFNAFQAQLKERCVEPPVISELDALESYGT
jgi:quinol monooxygenase YgiN